MEMEIATLIQELVFDHMLTLLAFHSNFDLVVKADGDLEVCDHHTIEDCGILLGKLFLEALGDKRNCPLWKYESSYG